MPQVDSDVILSWFKLAVESRTPITAEAWMEGALKLNILLADDHELLVELERKVAEKKMEILKQQEKKSVALAEAEVEASEEFTKMRLQRFKVERVEEQVRLAKKAASINDWK